MCVSVLLDSRDSSQERVGVFQHNVALQQQSFFDQYQLWIIIYLYGLSVVLKRQSHILIMHATSSM